MRDIAKVLGLASGTPVREWLDPEYRKYRQKRENDRRAGDPPCPLRRRSKAKEALEGERRLLSVPRDTRDLTARFCGDPLPGRSALDHKHEMALRPGEIPFQ